MAILPSLILGFNLTMKRHRPMSFLILLVEATCDKR
jgi:hypothetical protein